MNKYFIWLVGVAAVISAGFYVGFLRFNYPSVERYPVRGVDISHHQGVIDWRAAAANGVQFAYIKATEGVDYKDRRFIDNWVHAAGAGSQPPKAVQNCRQFGNNVKRPKYQVLRKCIVNDLEVPGTSEVRCERFGSTWHFGRCRYLRALKE